MKFVNITKDNFNNYLYSGIFLIFISILDVFLNSFFSINITSFLPGFLSFCFTFNYWFYRALFY